MRLLGAITRARDGRDGAAPPGQVEHDIVYITDKTLKTVFVAAVGSSPPRGRRRATGHCLCEIRRPPRRSAATCSQRRHGLLSKTRRGRETKARALGGGVRVGKGAHDRRQQPAQANQAALFHVEYTTFHAEGDEEDLELHEVMS